MGRPPKKGDITICVEEGCNNPRAASRQRCAEHEAKERRLASQFRRDKTKPMLILIDAEGRAVLYRVEQRQTAKTIGPQSLDFFQEKYGALVAYQGDQLVTENARLKRLLQKANAEGGLVSEVERLTTIIQKLFDYLSHFKLLRRGDQMAIRAILGKEPMQDVTKLGTGNALGRPRN